MKAAKEAAAWCNENPDMPPEKVKEVMPEYQHALHRNQWTATFFKHLAPDLHDRFASIRPGKKEKPKKVKPAKEA